MSIERARAYLKEFGMEERIMELAESSATVELAAEALHCEPERIAKTLSFLVGEQPILIVAAGDARIDRFFFLEAVCSLAYIHLLFDTVDQELSALNRLFDMLFFYFFTKIIKNRVSCFYPQISHDQNLFQFLIKVLIYL